MRYEMEYNRMHEAEMYDWNDEWVIDKYGNLVLREEPDEITMKTISVED